MDSLLNNPSDLIEYILLYLNKRRLKFILINFAYCLGEGFQSKAFQTVIQFLRLLKFIDRTQKPLNGKIIDPFGEETK